MKYIRTEYSFEPSEVEGLYRRRTTHTLNPTFSMIWIKTSTNSLISINELFDGVYLPRKGGFYDLSAMSPESKVYVTREFIDLSLRYAGAASPASLRQRIQPNADYAFSKMPEIENENIVRNVFDEGLIIERSPPEWMSLRHLIEKSSVGAGVTLAIGAISTNQWILFAAIPGGVVLMGAAVGIAKGLQAGLHHSVERYIKRRFK